MPNITQLDRHILKFDNCQACELHKTRNRMVFYRGATQWPVDTLFVGEAPGDMEDRQGIPFVGRSGNVLNDIIAMIPARISLCCKLLEIPIRPWTWGITNTLACRPPGNADPTSSQLTACANRFLDIFEKTNPTQVVAVGRVADEYLFPVFSSPSRQMSYVHIYHPAYLLRRGSSELLRESLVCSSTIAYNMAKAWAGKFEIERKANASKNAG